MLITRGRLKGGVSQSTFLVNPTEHWSEGELQKGCNFYSLIKLFCSLIIFPIKFTFKDHINGVQLHMPITVATGLQKQKAYEDNLGYLVTQ